MDVKLKVCCIKSIEEAHLAIAAGADAIGLVGQMPSGPGIIDDATIRSIVNHVGNQVDTFLLTSETEASAIVDHHYRTLTSTIQLVDHVPFVELVALREGLPDVRLIQVIHVVNGDAIEEVIRVSQYVDAILLDSGKPNAAQRTLGGTGETHNWNISKEIVKNLSIPVFLAGGINASNVREAINLVQPHGIDLCSGVRKNDTLDDSLLSKFIGELKSF